MYTKAMFGTPESVLIIEASLFQLVLNREVPLYIIMYNTCIQYDL